MDVRVVQASGFLPGMCPTPALIGWFIIKPVNAFRLGLPRVQQSLDMSADGYGLDD